MHSKGIINTCILILFFTLSVKAQDIASVYWSCMLPDSHRVSSVAGQVEGLPQVGSPGFVVRDYNNGPGPDQRWYPFADGSAVLWGNETGQVDTRWIQFGVHPKPNHVFNSESIALYLGAKGTGNIKANIYYSKDTSFTTAALINDTELTLVKDNDSLYNFVLDEIIESGETLYVRIYPWYTGSTSTSKYVYLREVTISGSTMGVTYPASAVWELTNPSESGTGQMVATSGQITAENEYLNNMEINQYTGPNGSQRLRIAGNAWPANQTTQIDTVFVQFSLSPKTGFTFYASTISLQISQMSINTMKANIYYSTDPAFTEATMIEYVTGKDNNYLWRDSLQAITVALNSKVNSGESLYLRIYPWVDNDPSVRTGKYITLQNVVIGGEVEGNPVQASATWSYQSDDKPVNVGGVIAGNSSYSPSMKFYGLTTLPKTDGGDVTVGAIQTISKEWNAESEPSDSLYFQYEVSPKFGATFFVDSVSLYIGGWFTDKLRAELYYSKDSDFSAKKMMITDTALIGDAVMPLNASVSETVNTGETFYLRIYPYNTEAQGWAKLVAVYNVVISGTTVGVTADPPTVLTAGVSYISTTHATSGGSIPSDGGSLVAARGVVWNTSGSPTINDSKTTDGSGSGSFISHPENLLPGTKYFLRAYAMNDAGTSYGEEKYFTTLDSIAVPTIVTSSVSNILVRSAQSGGNFTLWGGDTVMVRGVCWNTTGNPTISDFKTENGSGSGAFISVMFPLEASTRYYVRAFASNRKGTGYGDILEFITQAPAPDVVKTVAQDGSGDYTTVQAAFDDVPDFYTGEYRIFIRKGVYYEKLFLDRNKVNVILEGEDRDETILTYDDYAGKAGGTSNSYSVAIDPDDFLAMNITFRNTVKNDGSFADQQGVALRVNGDRQAYYNCNLLGYQDTYYTWGGRGTGRTYMKNCYIEGSVDFIFGRNVVLFDSCQININRNGGTLTAASTEPDALFGYVFRDCKITSDSIGFNGEPITSFLLGRPWQGAPRTVFINCDEPAALSAAGWSTWNVTPGLYAEYKCFGTGSDYSNRISISRQLTDQEATLYTMENIFGAATYKSFGYDWMPSQNIITRVNKGDDGIQQPGSFKLWQNYPNPFNPSTKIKYQIPEKSNVEIKVFNILGQVVKTLVNGEKPAGYYEVSFNASELTSGVYFYSFNAGNFIQIKKMLLLK